MDRPYRPCVVGVIHKNGEILVAERSDTPGCWQLPQGGVEPGETPEAAVIREMGEELGVAHVKVVGRLTETISYDFPPWMAEGPARKFRGQSQIWFVLELGPSSAVDLSKGDGEFTAWKWTSVDQCVEGIVHWKKEAYLAAFSQLKAKGLLAP